jgi:hypothetical protein
MLEARSWKNLAGVAEIEVLAAGPRAAQYFTSKTPARFFQLLASCFLFLVSSL